MKFSIIVPLYNKSKSIKACLDSVFSQNYQAFEVIIVNDGSTDNSLEVVNNLLDDRCKVYTIQNGGVSIARNYGISKANYEHIAFLDADDFWHKDYLQTMANIFADNSGIGMAGTGFEYYFGNKTITPRFQLAKEKMHYFTKENYFLHCKKNYLFWTSAVVIRKSVFEKTGYFDERIKIGEDLDMWFRVLLYNSAIFFNKPLAFYNKLSENKAGSLYKDFDSFLQSYILDKYDSFYHAMPFFRWIANELIIVGLWKQALKSKQFFKIYPVVKKTKPDNFRHGLYKQYYKLLKMFFQILS